MCQALSVILDMSWFWSKHVDLLVSDFFFFLISNEIFFLLKYQEKIHPSMQEVYNRDKNNQIHELQASIKEKTEKLEWLPTADDQSN